MRFQTAWISDEGGKKINDDTALIRQKKGTYVFVGDGLGGYAGGKQASQTASLAVMETVGKESLLEEENLRAAAARAHEAVLALQQTTQGKMKTTLVFLAMEGGKARWMHIGDSRLYFFHKGKLKKQTMDHSVSQMAVLMGDITLDQIRFHEDRNRVLRALGAENPKAEVSAVYELEKGDAFLLCTDGFWEFVYEDEMEATLAQSRNPKAWLSKMEEILRQRIPEDTDNYTAAAVICRAF